MATTLQLWLVRVITPVQFPWQHVQHSGVDIEGTEGGRDGWRGGGGMEGGRDGWRGGEGAWY